MLLRRVGLRFPVPPDLADVERVRGVLTAEVSRVYLPPLAYSQYLARVAKRRDGLPVVLQLEVR